MFKPEVYYFTVDGIISFQAVGQKNHLISHAISFVDVGFGFVDDVKKGPINHWSYEIR